MWRLRAAEFLFILRQTLFGHTQLRFQLNNNNCVWQSQGHFTLASENVEWTRGMRFCIVNWSLHSLRYWDAGNVSLECGVTRKFLQLFNTHTSWLRIPYHDLSSVCRPPQRTANLIAARLSFSSPLVCAHIESPSLYLLEGTLHRYRFGIYIDLVSLSRFPSHQTIEFLSFPCRDRL